MNTKPKTQEAANMNTFDAIPVGGMFSHVSKKTYRLIEVYVKVDAEHVQAADGRVWHLGNKHFSGIFCPHGTYSNGQSDVSCRLFGMTNDQARATLKS